MIDTHKNMIKCQIEHKVYYVNNATSLQMAWISLINEKLVSQNNSRNMILFDVYFGKLFNFNILILYQYLGSYKKIVEIRHMHV